MKKPKPISEQLKDAIDQAGESRYAISKATGIPQPTLSRFMNGKRPLTLGIVDRLCAYLNLQLTKGR